MNWEFFNVRKILDTLQDKANDKIDRLTEIIF